jgi:predicted Zn-ribbon and HTH transcriptional regulator
LTARYRVELGDENPMGNEDDKKLGKELENLASHATGTGNEENLGHFAFITHDLKAAKEVARKAIKAYKECGFEDRTDAVRIERLPECPKCEYPGKQGESYCPHCQTKLTTRQRIDIEP